MNLDLSQNYLKTPENLEHLPKCPSIETLDLSNNMIEYSDKLLKEQKELLTKFITSFNDSLIELNVYLNDEISRLKTELKKSLNIKEIQEDTQMKTNASKVIEMLESYKNKKPDIQMVKEVIKVQSLVQELNANVN